MTRTPAEGGLRMPAGWRPHAGTWLQWPHDDGCEGAIDVRLLPPNDVWARDSGPILVANDQGELTATDLPINGPARFVDQTTVLYSWTDDTSHPRHTNFGTTGMSFGRR